VCVWALRFSGRGPRRSRPMIPIHDTPDGATFAVEVRPRAKKNAVTGELGDGLKLALATPPVDGRANQACIEFLANLLKVPCSSVTITSGETSRNKVIRVAGLSSDEVRRRLRM
jgi:uncharacterized protein